MLTSPLLWLIDAGILSGLWTLGILTVRFLLPRSGFLEQISLGYGLGIGIITWILFLLSWAGVPLNRITILFVFFILVAMGILGRKLAGRQAAPPPDPAELKPGRISVMLDSAGWILFVIFGVALLILSVGLSYYVWDAMAIWSVKGYGIGLEGSIFAAAQWGAKGLAYPLNIPLGISIFFAFDHDLLPGSKLLFPGFLISLLIGIYFFLKKQNLPAWLTWCVVFAIGTTPILLQYSLIGYANVPYAYYQVLGTLWIAWGLKTEDLRRVTAGGILLALSIWTRLEGLEFWLVAVIGLAVVWRREMVRRNAALAIALPALIVGISWVGFVRLNQATTGETTVLFTALTRMLHGEFHPLAVYTIARYAAYLVIRTGVYGSLLPLAIGLALLLAIFSRRVRKDRLTMTLLGCGLLIGIGVMGMYYMTSYDSSMSLLAWLGTGFDRMLFGAVILLAMTSGIILWQASTDKQKPI